MCTYLTEKFDATRSSGKGPDGWFALEQGMVYFDHPVHAPDGHTLNIDFLAPSKGPAARVAVELSKDAAVALVAAINSALAAAPEDH